jgi:putative hydrolase of the HAD superfamily
MGILSNGWTELQHLKAELIGFRGPVLASEEIDEWKPCVEAFRIALARFKMDAATTMYVGDDPLADVAGAMAAGMPAAWADLEGKTYPNDAPQPSLTIDSLAQLLKIVN